MNEQAPSPNAANNQTPLIIYILYLASFMLGITSLIGLIMAYLSKADANALEQNHYRYQIRTFWIGMLYFLIAGILMFVFIGWLLIPLIMIWYIIRCVKGMMAFNKGEAIANVETWLF